MFGKELLPATCSSCWVGGHVCLVGLLAWHLPEKGFAPLLWALHGPRALHPHHLCPTLHPSQTPSWLPVSALALEMQTADARASLCQGSRRILRYRRRGPALCFPPNPPRPT